MTLPKVVLTSQLTTERVVSSPREQLSNQIVRISQLQRKTTQVQYYSYFTVIIHHLATANMKHSNT